MDLIVKCYLKMICKNLVLYYRKKVALYNNHDAMRIITGCTLFFNNSIFSSYFLLLVYYLLPAQSHEKV